MLNILQWLIFRLRRGMPPPAPERRCGQERRQLTDRRSEQRVGEQWPSRRHRQRRYVRTVSSR